MMLQIQPVYARKEEYAELAAAEGLKYELLEPAFGILPEREAYYAGTGLVHSLHGAFIDINPGSGDADFRRLSEEKCRQSCRLAKELGAEYVVFHSSCFPVLRGAYMDSWAARCCDFYRKLAGEFDLKLSLENSFDIDPQPLQALMQGCAQDPRIRVCLDLGHVNISRKPATQWVKDLKNEINYLHLSDNQGTYDEHLPLGAGTVDWKADDELTGWLPAETPVTLEVGGLEGIRCSLDYLKIHHLFGR